ncbi:hypothetical protein FDJ20_gp103 [Vibrio phage Thalassa]|uniref:Uncharacterized protein n=1 Tax=Vibrio phage Thalassa TaxID=2570301 RepID=A0A2H5BHG2_9CAUD|nr:hypothetical protein FDJ20_gp008 [Vibrio phage Thalassa]YP_009621480.1 hypothetical protein FDJ20_gp103 [Vibrio phage Thalassa]AUG85210.1 hypothetical protein THALASSA_8 [Vibrio phage Thalassa]AUG85399.1 hypothetical protein THALASSA_220 [Vibrio phage Thalassa]
MGFNCKETPTLISLDSIIAEARKIIDEESPENTVWYIENDSQLAVMVNPAYGIMFYNDQMNIEGLCNLGNNASIDFILNGYGLTTNDPVWREIGIDQVDYHFVS